MIGIKIESTATIRKNAEDLLLEVTSETTWIELDLPLDKGVDHALDPRSVTAGRLTGAILVAAVSFPGLLGVVGTAVGAPWGPMPKLLLLIAWIGITVAGAILAYAWPRARYRRPRYRVDERGLTIRRGIFWRSETFIPRTRVQHTDVVQGPLQRLYELATLIVHTAGTQDASVGLSGLSYSAALPIRDFLIGGDDEEGGV